jgi:penicillin-binding protein 1A
VPAGIKLIRVSASSGLRAGSGEGGGVILEAFKPGTAPPDGYSVVGSVDGAARAAAGASPEAQRAVGTGAGGLY